MFFFNDTATTEIYTLSLHDALPISSRPSTCTVRFSDRTVPPLCTAHRRAPHLRMCDCSTWRLSASPRCWRRSCPRSEEHTSELQSRQYLVCRLLLARKTTSTRAATA